MLIQVNDQFRIKSDSVQWMIQKRRTRNGKRTWESRLFFPSFQGAVKELGELMVRESEAQTLADALVAIEKIATTLCQALTPHLERVSDMEEKEVNHD